jgi:hypothetical protein
MAGKCTRKRYKLMTDVVVSPHSCDAGIKVIFGPYDSRRSRVMNHHSAGASAGGPPPVPDRPVDDRGK